MQLQQQPHFSSMDSPSWAQMTPQMQSRSGLQIPCANLSRQQNQLKPAYSQRPFNPCCRHTHPSHNKETAADKVTLFFLVFFFRVNLLKVKVIWDFASPASDLLFLQKSSPHKCHKELLKNIIKPHKKIVGVNGNSVFWPASYFFVVCWFGRHFANSLGFIPSVNTSGV